MTDSIDPQAIQDLKERFDHFSDEIIEFVRAEWPTDPPTAQPVTDDTEPIGPVESKETAPDKDPWPEALFGAELTECGEKWITDLLAGRPDAVVLTGQWLQVRAADDKQFPNLLRQLGEAFYRWSPKTKAADDPLEKTLIRTLNDRARELGLRNSIEPVSPGDRFDANRHNPQPGQRGMTVDAVLGWIVMRDDRVFAKATVSVK